MNNAQCGHSTNQGGIGCSWFNHDSKNSSQMPVATGKLLPPVIIIPFGHREVKFFAPFRAPRILSAVIGRRSIAGFWIRLQKEPKLRQGWGVYITCFVEYVEFYSLITGTFFCWFKKYNICLNPVNICVFTFLNKLLKC